MLSFQYTVHPTSLLADARNSFFLNDYHFEGMALLCPTVLFVCNCFHRHVSDVLADEMTGGKVLVFAHHRNVLDALEQGVLKTGNVEYIRIDGRTKVNTCLRHCQ